MKPVEMYMRCINNSTKPAAVVSECFMGSGTTLLACEQAGRVCRGTELDPSFCDVIVERWQQYTGGKARRVAG